MQSMWTILCPADMLSGKLALSVLDRLIAGEMGFVRFMPLAQSTAVDSPFDGRCGGTARYSLAWLVRMSQLKRRLPLQRQWGVVLAVTLYCFGSTVWLLGDNRLLTTQPNLDQRRNSSAFGAWVGGLRSVLLSNPQYLYWWCCYFDIGTCPVIKWWMTSWLNDYRQTTLGCWLLLSGVFFEHPCAAAWTCRGIWWRLLLLNMPSCCMIWIHVSKYDVIADRPWSDDCCFLSDVSLDTHTVYLHELVEARAR